MKSEELFLRRFYLLNKTTEIGVRNILQIRFVIDRHQCNKYLVIVLLLHIISYYARSTALTFSFRGNGHTVLVSMLPKRLSAIWICLQLIKKCVEVVFKRRIFLSKSLCPSLEFIKIVECNFHLRLFFE